MLLDLPRETVDVVVRQLNDELSAMAMHANSASAASASSSSMSMASSAAGNLASLMSADVKGLQADEVLRRVEDIARLH
jgi:hypothetical protein